MTFGFFYFSVRCCRIAAGAAQKERRNRGAILISHIIICNVKNNVKIIHIFCQKRLKISNRYANICLPEAKIFLWKGVVSLKIRRRRR